MEKRAVFKNLNNQQVLLCSRCRTVIKYYKDFSEEEKIAAKGKLKLPAQYCDKCEEELHLYDF